MISLKEKYKQYIIAKVGETEYTCDFSMLEKGEEVKVVSITKESIIYQKEWPYSGIVFKEIPLSLLNLDQLTTISRNLN